nr:MAG TPA: envelope glycoprotein [Inoviridae sp.]
MRHADDVQAFAIADFHVWPFPDFNFSESQSQINGDVKYKKLTCIF